MNWGNSSLFFIGGARIQVQRHIPPQTYPNKVLVIQINSKTTHVELRTFLKTRTNLDVEEVYFGGDDSGKAVVTFSDAIGRCFGVLRHRMSSCMKSLT